MDFLTVDAVCSSSVRLVPEDPGLLSSSLQLCSTSVTGGKADAGSIVLSSSLSPTASLVDVDHGAACTRISRTRGLIVVFCITGSGTSRSRISSNLVRGEADVRQRTSQKSWDGRSGSKWPERVSTIPKTWDTGLRFIGQGLVKIGLCATCLHSVIASLSV